MNNNNELLCILKEAKNAGTAPSMPVDERMQKINRFLSVFTPDFVEKMLCDLKEKDNKINELQSLMSQGDILDNGHDIDFEAQLLSATQRADAAEQMLKRPIKLPDAMHVKSAGKTIAVIHLGSTKKCLRAMGLVLDGDEVDIK